MDGGVNTGVTGVVAGRGDPLPVVPRVPDPGQEVRTDTGGPPPPSVGAPSSPRGAADASPRSPRSDEKRVDFGGTSIYTTPRWIGRPQYTIADAQQRVAADDSVPRSPRQSDTPVPVVSAESAKVQSPPASPRKSETKSPDTKVGSEPKERKEAKKPKEAKHLKERQPATERKEGKERKEGGEREERKEGKERRERNEGNEAGKNPRKSNAPDSPKKPRRAKTLDAQLPHEKKASSDAVKKPRRSATQSGAPEPGHKQAPEKSPEAGGEKRSTERVAKRPRKSKDNQGQGPAQSPAQSPENSRRMEYSALPSQAVATNTASQPLASSMFSPSSVAGSLHDPLVLSTHRPTAKPRGARDNAGNQTLIKRMRKLGLSERSTSAIEGLLRKLPDLYTTPSAEISAALHKQQAALHNFSRVTELLDLHGALKELQTKDLVMSTLVGLTLLATGKDYAEVPALTLFETLQAVMRLAEPGPLETSLLSRVRPDPAKVPASVTRPTAVRLFSTGLTTVTSRATVPPLVLPSLPEPPQQRQQQPHPEHPPQPHPEHPQQQHPEHPQQQHPEQPQQQQPQKSRAPQPQPHAEQSQQPQPQQAQPVQAQPPHQQLLQQPQLQQSRPARPHSDEPTSTLNLRRNSSPALGRKNKIRSVDSRPRLPQVVGLTAEGLSNLLGKKEKFHYKHSGPLHAFKNLLEPLQGKEPTPILIYNALMENIASVEDLQSLWDDAGHMRSLAPNARAWVEATMRIAPAVALAKFDVVLLWNS